MCLYFSENKTNALIIREIQKQTKSIWKNLELLEIALRQSLPYYSIPIVTSDLKNIQFDDIYHPLIPNCVSNSLIVSNKSILLTGVALM